MNTRFLSALFALTATAASLVAAEPAPTSAPPTARVNSPTALRAELPSPDAQIRALLDAARAAAGGEEIKVTPPVVAVPASLLNVTATPATAAASAEKSAPVRAKAVLAGL